MSYSTVPVLIAPTRDTHENWTANNPVLPAGVMGVVTGRIASDSVEFFIGDGTSAYNDLPKSGAKTEELETKTSSLSTELGSLSTLNESQHQYLYEGRDLTSVFADEIAEHTNVWAWIKARIDAVNYEGLRIGDYIPFQMNGETVEAQIAGIDTYYNCGDTAIGHHIDFISRDCYSETVLWNTTATNNGTASQMYPWLASNIYSVLNNTWLGYLPTELQNVIVTKRMLLETRYSSSGSLTASTSWDWQDMGKLWLPLCIEVLGSSSWGTQGYSVGLGIQYPIFIGSKKYWIKGAGHNGSRAWWWTATPSGVSASNAVHVSNHGNVTDYSASDSGGRAPVCFRIA